MLRIACTLSIHALRRRARAFDSLTGLERRYRLHHPADGLVDMLTIFAQLLRVERY